MPPCPKRGGWRRNRRRRWGRGRREEEEGEADEEGRASTTATGRLDASRSLLGYLLGDSSRPLRASWGFLGSPRGFFERLGCPGGASSNLFLVSWGHLGALLEVVWGLLGDSWLNLGVHRSNKRVDPFTVFPSGPSDGPRGGLLGRSSGALGRSWGALGALFCLSWGSLGPSWSHL